MTEAFSGNENEAEPVTATGGAARHMTPDLIEQDLYSIGRAASVVGIAPATLRMWERRYGTPIPVRLPSGHRRYTGDQVRWLKRVTEAMHPHTDLALPCLVIMNRYRG